MIVVWLLVAFGSVLPIAAGQNSTSSALSALPACAVPCFVTSIVSSPCAPDDQACICADENLQEEITTCVLASCTTRLVLTTKNVTATACGEPIRDRGNEYSITANVLGVISAVIVLLRVLFKIFIAKVGLHADDWLILVTMLTGIPSTVITSLGAIKFGLGRDVWTLTPAYVTTFGTYFYVMQVAYYWLLCMLKMSLLFFYLRIFPDQGVKKVLWATVGFNAAFGCAFVILSIFICTPVSYFWTRWGDDAQTGGKCVNINAVTWSNAIISISLDIWMLAIPLWQLWGLRLHWTKKVGVAIMFCTGTFVTVISILRLHALVSYANSLNPTWDDYEISIWSTVEINVGIICACMPTLRLILVRIFPFMGTTRSRPSYYPANDTAASRRKDASRRASRGATLTSANQHDIVVGGGAPAKGISYKRSYAVHYAETDESGLVEMHDMDQGYESKEIAHQSKSECSSV